MGTRFSLASGSTPLPARITVDIDHDMSVRGTIGSAVPWIDDDGNLRISGTFASTPPRAGGSHPYGRGAH